MFDVPTRMALISDNEIVIHGLVAMIDPATASVRVLRSGAQQGGSPVDITLIDASMRKDDESAMVERVVADPDAGAVVLCGWELSPASARSALRVGCRGCFDRSLSGEELNAALERVLGGEVVVSPGLIDGADPDGETDSGETWFGQHAGLSPRESEVIIMITRGCTNAEIAESCYLSVNTVKYYVRSAYRKIGVERRAQAVKWGMEYKTPPFQAHGHVPMMTSVVQGAAPGQARGRW